MTLIRLIAVFILIYLVFRVITLYIMPWVLKKIIQRQRRKFYGNHHSKNRPKNNTKIDDDEANVNYRQKRQFTSDDIGEYVDFKEIKDNKTSKKKDNEANN